jgi:proline iminopeptidase
MYRNRNLATTLILIAITFAMSSCQQATAPKDAPEATAEAAKPNEDGVKMIPVKTEKGTFRVWTRKIGDNPRIKILLLHGGPGGTHECFEVFEKYFPGEGFEFYYYNQLGSYLSDRPEEPELWDTPRFVEEVEQVRQGLGLGKENFYLYGQSWGGILAIEYALKYQQHLKGLVISNMMASIPAYNEYAERVLMPAMDQKVLAEIKALEASGKYTEPRYMELLMPHHYEKHLLRLPQKEWPDAVNRAFQHMNASIYVPMQGPSELGASGKLLHWDRTKDLKKITVPTLVIGAEHDTMDPAHMRWMGSEFPKGRFHYCPNGSHLAMWDDEKTYMEGLIRFVKDVDAGTF